MGRAREWVGWGWGCLLLFRGGTGGAGIDLFDRFHGLTEDIETELLKLGMGKHLQKVISVIKRLKACGLLRGKRVLGLFYFALERVQHMNIGRNVGASFFLYCLTKYSIIWLSKYSPPRWVSPAVAKTSKTPSSIERRETSKAPPPRIDNDAGLRLVSFLSRPYVMAAVVSLLIIRRI